MPDSAASRSRWLRSVGTVGLAVLAAIFVAMLATNWVVVDVRSHDDGPERIVMPVPLNMVRIPLHMVPRNSLHVPLPRSAEWSRQRYLSIVDRLSREPEGTVIEVEEDDAVLELSRRGTKLVIETSDRCGDVRISLPFEATHRLLRRTSMDRFEPLAVLDLLASSERGELVAVDARDASLRITTW